MNVELTSMKLPELGVVCFIEREMEVYKVS